MCPQIYMEKAKMLIRRVHEAGVDDEEWLQLEEEVSKLFSTLPDDQFDIISELFCDDGAGEMLDMVCNGIRYFREQKKQY